MLLTILLLQAAAQSPPVATSDEVTVAARKISRLRISTHKDRKTGVVTCRFKRRSGDADLDAGMCAALLTCRPKVRTRAELEACMDPAIKALLPKAVWQK